MDQQQNVQRLGDLRLCIDGYISQMFDPRVADEYHVSLLRREPGQIQLQADVAGTGAFFATPPPGPTSGQHGWIVDYAVKDTGPVIRQKIWAPKKSSDKLRWVDHEQLHPPIFFIHKNGHDLGLPLKEAAGGNCMRLRGAEEAAPVGSRAHAQIRINVSSIFGVHGPELMVKVSLLSGVVMYTSTGTNKSRYKSKPSREKQSHLKHSQSMSQGRL
jgi:hypothetical protein